MNAPPPGRERGLLDTSVFVARETGRAHGALPTTAAISVVTIAELHLGVLLADGPKIRAQRLPTLSLAQAAFDSHLTWLPGQNQVQT